MAEILSKHLDLNLAWRRIKHDAENRNFVRHPYEIALVEQDLRNWLDGLGKNIDAGTYNPRPPIVCDVPKGNGGIRAGAHLCIEDRVVYAACVGACGVAISNEVAWARNSVDYSYPLAESPTAPDWITSKFPGWRDFDAKSLKKIERGNGHVVITDVSGFYDNIDISTLASDLRQIHAMPEVIKQLSACLNRWAISNGRGIPQGQTPSDILAKLYFNSIDRNLKALGYEHYRYVDDIRIFCCSASEAKRALLDLNRLLRKRGLCLQSAKTRMCNAIDAKAAISSTVSTIQRIAKRYVRGIASALVDGNPYMHIAEAENALLEGFGQIQPAGLDNVPAAVIRRAYTDHFVTESIRFDKSLFHFLLNRMAKQQDAFAVQHATSLLERHPEETHAILKYVRSVGADAEAGVAIINFLRSDESVYAYQTYEIIEWYSSFIGTLPEEILAVARKCAFDAAQPSYLKAICRKVLGDHGTAADLERLEHLYPDAHDALEQAEIMCSVRRLESGRRNSFLARSERDGDVNSRAARLVRQQ